jgi:hypothetical protein
MSEEKKMWREWKTDTRKSREVGTSTSEINKGRKSGKN